MFVRCFIIITSYIIKDRISMVIALVYKSRGPKARGVYDQGNKQLITRAHSLPTFRPLDFENRLIGFQVMPKYMIFAHIWNKQ